MRPMGDANVLPSAIEEAARRLARATEAESIILFGSRARGDWRDDSDWDLCVILPDGVAPGKFTPITLWPTRFWLRGSDPSLSDTARHF